MRSKPPPPWLQFLLFLVYRILRKILIASQVEFRITRQLSGPRTISVSVKIVSCFWAFVYDAIRWEPAVTRRILCHVIWRSVPVSGEIISRCRIHFYGGITTFWLYCGSQPHFLADREKIIIFLHSSFYGLAVIHSTLLLSPLMIATDFTRMYLPQRSAILGGNILSSI